MATGYEIDFLPVGNGERSGDATCLRYGSPGDYKVMVYDGGTKESGMELVKHIRAHYGTNVVDYVVCSHPDADHASGLAVVLDEMQVGELWIHRPWAHSQLICQYFKDGRITDSSLGDRLKEKMAAAHALEELAVQRGVLVYEPFQGDTIGEFYVLSPNRDWYVHELIADFEKSPEKKQVDATDGGNLLWKVMAKAAQRAASSVAESWGFETLRENVSTSAENESSVVLFGVVADRGILLTGDAGVQALSAAAGYAEARGVSIPEHVKFAQIPHHGSRNNVSPSVLDRLIGPKSTIPAVDTRVTAYVSAAKESETHPRKAVVNAFIRRGAKVVPTKGQAKCHHWNMDNRSGWEPAEPLPFSPEVESWA